MKKILVLIIPQVFFSFLASLAQAIPYTVSSTNISTAIQYPYQRKAFYANGRFWVFFANGSDYLYTSSINGVDWTQPKTIRDEPNMHSNITTRYFTPTLIKINNQQNYWLSTQLPYEFSQSYILATSSADWGIEVFIVNLTGGEKNLTSAKVAIVTRTSLGEGYQSASWTPPSTILSAGDAIKIAVYIRSPSGSGIWYSVANFTTKQLEATQLIDSIWNVTYYTLLDTEVAAFSYGIFYYSRIENFTLTPLTSSGEKFSVWYNNSHIAYALSSASVTGPAYTPLIYRLGIPQSDGNINWITYEQIAFQSANDYGALPFIALDSYGYPFIGYANNLKGNLIKSSLNNGSWSTSSGFPIQISNSTTSTIITPLDSGKMEIFYSSDIFSACKALANLSEPNAGVCQIPLWKDKPVKLCIDFINTNPYLDGDNKGGSGRYIYYPDKKVDMNDVFFVSVKIGKKCGDSDFDQMADINNNCSIDVYDYTISNRNYGKTGDYIYNLTGVHLTFDTGETKYLDNENCTEIPQNAKNFTIYNSSNQKVGAMVLFYPPLKARLWNGSMLLSEQIVSNFTPSNIYSFSAVAYKNDTHIIFLNFSDQIFHINGSYNIIHQNFSFSSPILVSQGASDSYPTLTLAPPYLYAFWASYPNSNYIYYKKYDGSWDASPTAWITSDILTSNYFLTSYYRMNSLEENKIGLIWMNSSSPYQIRHDYLEIFPSGWLNATLLYPQQQTTNLWEQNLSYFVNATITCKDGYCFNVNATIRYNKTSSLPDTRINTSYEKPFYILNGFLRPINYMITTIEGYVSNPSFAYDNFYNDTTTYAKIYSLPNGYSWLGLTFFFGEKEEAVLFATVSSLYEEYPGALMIYNFTLGDWDLWLYPKSTILTNSTILSRSNGLINSSGYSIIYAFSSSESESTEVRLYDIHATVLNSTLNCENLGPEKNCTLAWEVKVTGDLDSYWKIDLNSSFENGWNDTQDATIKIVDLTPPLINIISPQNKTYNTSYFFANVSLNEACSDVFYSLDSTSNQSLVKFNSTYFYKKIYSSKGAHKIVFYATDEAGNENSSYVFFYLNLTGYTTLKLSLKKVWWNDSILAYGQAKDLEENPIESMVKVLLNEKECENYTDTNGNWFCEIKAPNEIGSYLLNVSVGGIFNSTYLKVSPFYGLEEKNVEKRVYEIPVLIQDKNGKIKSVWLRLTNY